MNDWANHKSPDKLSERTTTMSSRETFSLGKGGKEENMNLMNRCIRRKEEEEDKEERFRRIILFFFGCTTLNTQSSGKKEKAPR